MIVSLKRFLLLLILTLILLTGLLSWTTHMVAAPITPTYHNQGYHSHNCPPPPYDCW